MSRRTGRRLRRRCRPPPARPPRRRARARPWRRPAGSPRPRSPRPRGQGRGTARRWRAAAPRGLAPRGRAPGRAHRGSARTRRSRRRSRSCATLRCRSLRGDEPGALRREVQRLVHLIPANAEVAVPSGAEHREDLPAAARAAADRVDGDPVARLRFVEPVRVCASRPRSSARRLRCRRQRPDERVVRAARDHDHRAARVAEHGVRDAAEQHMAGRPVRARAADEEIDPAARAR